MPALALALSLLVLSHSGIFIRFAQADAVAIGFWRMAMVVPMLLLLVLQQKQWGLVRGLGRRQWAGLFVCGLCLFAHWWSWFLAVQKTALANSMVLFAISPIFTALGAWIVFGEKISRRHLLALAFCFAGILVLFYGSLRLDPSHLAGDGLGLLASVLFSAYVLASKGVRATLPNLPFTLVTYSFSGLLFLALMQAFQLPLADYSSQTWIAFAALAVGPTLLGHALFTYCLQFFNVNLMNILLLTEPVIASASAYVILKEPLNFHQALGFLAIAAGVVVLFARRSRQA
jgi:drug/metabolite transporter (DMT)-like permease